MDFDFYHPCSEEISLSMVGSVRPAMDLLGLFINTQSLACPFPLKTQDGDYTCSRIVPCAEKTHEDLEVQDYVMSAVEIPRSNWAFLEGFSRSGGESPPYNNGTTSMRST